MLKHGWSATGNTKYRYTWGGGRESCSEVQKYGGGERAIVKLRNNGGTAKVILKYRGE